MTNANLTLVSGFIILYKVYLFSFKNLIKLWFGGDRTDSCSKPEFGYGYGYDVICTWWMNTTCILGNCVVVFRYVNMDLDSSIFAEWIQLVQKTYVCVNNSVTVYSFTVIFISCLLIIKIRTIIAQHNYLRINVNFIHSPVPLLTSQHTCFAMCCSTTTTTCVQVTSLVILRLARFACSAPKLGLLIACFFPCM